jgi:extracellular factor (EF) 3-hydroxypalmitic acid methyl ester biosynthesis protein
MDLSFAPLSEASRMDLSATGAVTRALDFRSIPDPLRLRIEGIELRSKRHAPESTVVDWCEHAHDCLSFLAATDPSRIWIWQEQVLPVLLSGNFLKRCRDQRRGYPGDYLTVQMMHDGIATSKDSFGRAIDAWSMDQPFTKAVRNGPAMVRQFLQKIRAGSGKTPISVVSLGCGPAAEIFDLADMTDLQFTLVDSDQGALDHVRQKALAEGIASRIRTTREDVAKMAAGDRSELRNEYAAFYGLDLIDQLSDQSVVHLLDIVHAKLAPSGRVLLGNSRRGHPNAALFEHALNWPLSRRSKPELLRLVEKSRFASCPVAVASEPEGVQLFVECTKSPG